MDPNIRDYCQGSESGFVIKSYESRTMLPDPELLYGDHYFRSAVRTTDPDPVTQQQKRDKNPCLII
jgi:hypothetical protein